VVLADGSLAYAGSRAIKNATGYNLPQMLVGSRGALGVLVEATLRLGPPAGTRRAFLAGYPRADAAAAAAVAIAAERVPPLEVQLLTRRTLDLSPALAEATSSAVGSGAALLVGLEGFDSADLDAQSRRLAEVARETRATKLNELDERSAASAWTARRRLQDDLAEAHAGVAFAEVVAPTALVPALARLVLDLASRERADVALFGGVGMGSLEVAVLAAARGPALFLRKLAAEVARLGASLVGTESTGLSYDAWLDTTAPETASVMRQLKAALDPGGLLRPLGL
jgi:FAD/FMN-containing dehydrogenase